MVTPHSQVALEPLGSETESKPIRVVKNRVKGLSAWRGAKAGAVALASWVALLIVLQLWIEIPVSSEGGEGEWVAVAAFLLINSVVWGFLLGLLVGATVGVAFEVFGRSAAAIAGLVIPLAIAITLLEWQLSFDFWDSPGQHMIQFVVFAAATLAALGTIVSRHIQALLDYAVSPTRFERKSAT